MTAVKRQIQYREVAEKIRELEEQIICAKEQYEQLRQITMRLQEDGRRMRDYIRDRKKDHRP